MSEKQSSQPRHTRSILRELFTSERSFPLLSASFFFLLWLFFFIASPIFANAETCFAADEISALSVFRYKLLHADFSSYTFQAGLDRLRRPAYGSLRITSGIRLSADRPRPFLIPSGALGLFLFKIALSGSEKEYPAPKPLSFPALYCAHLLSFVFSALTGKQCLCHASACALSRRKSRPSIEAGHLLFPAPVSLFVSYIQHHSGAAAAADPDRRTGLLCQKKQRQQLIPYISPTQWAYPPFYRSLRNHTDSEFSSGSCFPFQTGSCFLIPADDRFRYLFPPKRDQLLLTDHRAALWTERIPGAGRRKCRCFLFRGQLYRPIRIPE